MRSIEVRPVQQGDLDVICRIVNHYIQTTAINFRTAPQTPQDWEEHWGEGRDRFPWLVAVSEGEVVGIAYAGPWNNRSAYDWCVETTVYVRHDVQACGVGSALYAPMLSAIDASGFVSAIGVVALPNPGSVALHEKFGFSYAGTLRSVGFKLGHWHDVGLYQRVTEALECPAEFIRGQM